MIILAEIQKLKHSVTKGDKKKKKETTEKIASLEADLCAKHQKELAELKEKKLSETVSTVRITILHILICFLFTCIFYQNNKDSNMFLFSFFFWLIYVT